MTLWSAIQGTEGWKPERRPDDPREWWDPLGNLAAYFATADIFPIDPDDPFVWTTELDGLEGADRDWLAGGKAYRYYLAAKRARADLKITEDLVTVVHSHGLQPALVAAAEGAKIPRLLSICSPIRSDFEEVALEARKRIRIWLHVYDPGDTIQAAGEIGDGHVGVVRAAPLANFNLRITGSHHGDRILRRPENFHLWRDLGLIAFMRTGELPTTAAP